VKIASDVKGLGPRTTARDFSTIARCEAKLVSARSVAEIIVIEAKAASVYWRSHRDLGLIERKGGNLPPSWLRFANRGRGAEFLGNKHASHPISAMINYCIVVEAGRLARALSGFGLALQIGFLHGDKHGRNSLVWDAIEPLRARINARVFAFIASHEFARSDFPANASVPIELRSQSSPSFWRVAYRRINTFSTAPRGCRIWLRATATLGTKVLGLGG
jgi:CRISPR/Cas system-associated endonuclease Cas1